ncbi:uncharacterized protein LOC123404797 isoform X2 [Hordeum vulgare subsp. vulgare]|uniref:uncharacterized protein LOC123404797 isoform X2 n=1 Tax=Hordeum vulgare subsp. vulgare TaxID=112509 RepID=UPI001D1A4081|nr:uncharacterized protein LOC123404797 isoform X2 [Hordeum vulgare subsp. vulgare]XP_044954678.1 uncharacterized protein LOC123404797 isoform X2 [Hordeum vulgare subsp. vulgare]
MPHLSPSTNGVRAASSPTGRGPARVPNRFGCEDSFDYVGSSTSQIRSSSKRGHGQDNHLPRNLFTDREARHMPDEEELGQNITSSTNSQNAAVAVLLLDARRSAAIHHVTVATKQLLDRPREEKGINHGHRFTCEGQPRKSQTTSRPAKRHHELLSE